MLQRFFFGTMFFLAVVTTGYGQSSGAVVIDSDMRLFTTMVALNAAGYDVELGQQYHPARVAARTLGQKLDPELVQRLKEFYATHKRSETDDVQLAKYISLAVMATAPPDLKLPVRDEVLPPDVRPIKGFVDLMREVYVKGNLRLAFDELRPQYETEMSRLAGPIREQLVKCDGYLRVPLGGSSTRSLQILVELAAPINSVNLRSDQDNYYVILGQSTTPHMDDIRHAYLHFQLDNLVADFMGSIANGPKLLNLIKNVPGVDRTYSGDLHAMMVESLIRAVELRMDRVPAPHAKEMINSSYRTGLLLMPYFYSQLQDYEGQDAGIRDIFPDMAVGIHVADEQARFDASFMSIPVTQHAAVTAEIPKAEVLPPPNPVRDLIKEGQAAWNANDSIKAKKAFENVLNSYDPNNGAALYGLALIASRDENSDAARDLFERSTKSEDVEPSMKVWAYIYLARIYDLQCQRERALQNYQQAIKLGDDTRKAQTVAAEGIKKPYGDGCY